MKVYEVRRVFRFKDNSLFHITVNRHEDPTRARDEAESLNASTAAMLKAAAVMWPDGNQGSVSAFLDDLGITAIAHATFVHDVEGLIEAAPSLIVSPGQSH